MLRLPRSIRLSALALTGAAAGMALVAAPPAVAEDEQTETKVDKELSKGEKRLAKLLEGRVAGEPQRCIRVRPSERFQTIDKTAYVWGSGNTIYVQRTRNPDDIDRDDILVQRRFTASEICKLDVATTVDRTIGFFTGAVFFEDFVPYTRVKEGEQAASSEG